MNRVTQALSAILVGLVLLIGSAAPGAAAVPSGLTARQQVIVDTITADAIANGVSPGYLLGVALCEDSTLDPEAVSPSGDYGIFQFHFTGPGVWLLTPEGAAGLMPWQVSVDTQIERAAELFAAGYGSAWSCA